MRDPHLPGAAEPVDEGVVGDEVRRAAEPGHFLEEPEPLLHHGAHAETPDEDVEGVKVGS